MGHVEDRQALLARAWDQAADGYEEYFVPRFAPWVATAVEGVGGADLPGGRILVPCCGTFPELPALVERLPSREIVGIDLSAGMVRLARRRAAGLPTVRVVQGDAATLDPALTGTCAAVVSVFGLQQLPDPAAALGAWVGALRPGGRLSVMFWPSGIEHDGPYALLSKVLSGHRRQHDDAWEAGLTDAVTSAGATVERDDHLAFPMEHPDAATFWDAVTGGGHARAFVLARGEGVMREMRREFLAHAPAGRWRHSPRARWILARRDQV